MKKNVKTALRWLATLALYAWASAAFLVLIGEENPQHPLSLTAFFAYKALAFAALYVAYRVGAFMWRKHIFPSVITGVAARLIREED